MVECRQVTFLRPEGINKRNIIGRFLRLVLFFVFLVIPLFGGIEPSAKRLLPVFLGKNPIILLLTATLNASFPFMLPVATPQNAIVFGSGYTRMDTMVRVGFRLNLIGVVLTTIFITAVSPFL